MIIERHLDVDVLTAAPQRIRNIFSNGLPVYLGFSGGKDSLVLADITVKMIEAGELDASRLRVVFIDEEAIFPCVDEIVKAWRAKFLLLGARFDWYCLEVRHYNCLNRLENDESFICWDRYKAAVWVRDPPPYAIRSHPLLSPRQDTYQQFLAKLGDGPFMTGLRVFESVQRRVAVASQRPVTDLKTRATVEPIYDWKDDDVWRYLADNNIDIPAAYLHLYQIGVRRNQLRISQFFSIDTAQSLARMAEFYPGLMRRILQREPAAYLVALYWDSEMFRRRSRQRRRVERETGKAPIDAKERVMALLSNIDANFSTAAQRHVANDYRRMVLLKPYIQPKHYELMYDALIAGDPKRRSFRSIAANIESAAAYAFCPGQSALTIAGSGNVDPPGATRDAETE